MTAGALCGHQVVKRFQIFDPNVWCVARSSLIQSEKDTGVDVQACMSQSEGSSQVLLGCGFSPCLSFSCPPYPTAIDLLYWRNVKQSGAVFSSVLLLLFSLTQFSVVSVGAYLALAALSATISFRIYKSVLQAVQKTDEGHPFK